MKFQDKATGSITLGLLALALGGCTALDAMRAARTRERWRGIGR